VGLPVAVLPVCVRGGGRGGCVATGCPHQEVACWACVRAVVRVLASVASTRRRQPPRQQSNSSLHPFPKRKKHRESLPRRCRCCRSGACPLSVRWLPWGTPPVPVLFVVAAPGSLAGSGRGGRCRVPAGSPGAFAASGGFCCFSGAARRQGDVSALGPAVLLAVRGWLPRLCPGCGGPPGGCFPRSRSILQHTGGGSNGGNGSLQTLQGERSRSGSGFAGRCRCCSACVLSGFSRSRRCRAWLPVAQ